MNLSNDIQSYLLQSDIQTAKTKTEMVYRTFEPLETTFSSMTIHKGLMTDSKLINYLNRLKYLPPNWDGEESIKPDEGAVQDAVHFVNKLLFIYPFLKIEQACPGSMGEIVIELRKKNKSVEFLFYPNKKWKYVSVGGKRPPEQGIFELKNLSNIITWLNGEA